MFKNDITPETLDYQERFVSLGLRHLTFHIVNGN